MAPSLADPEVYRWVDEKGKVHYTDKPPPGVGHKRLEITPAAPAAEVPSAADELHRFLSRRRQHDEERERERKDREQRREAQRWEDEDLRKRCVDLELQRDILSMSSAVFVDPSGKYHATRWRFTLEDQGARENPQRFLSDAEIEQAKARVNREIEAACASLDKKSLDQAYREQAHKKWCEQQRNLLMAMQKPERRIPNSEVRELEDSIAASCERE
ncbi:MAG: DUF4124 domain-containing protein [Gammaproteobacteria bacterium]